ncbi:hypothetical protein GCM10009664_60210 [Kitasatospora gansuensis]
MVATSTARASTSRLETCRSGGCGGWVGRVIRLPDSGSESGRLLRRYLDRREGVRPGPEG